MTERSQTPSAPPGASLFEPLDGSREGGVASFTVHIPSSGMSLRAGRDQLPPMMWSDWMHTVSVSEDAFAAETIDMEAALPTREVARATAASQVVWPILSAALAVAFPASARNQTQVN